MVQKKTVLYTILIVGEGPTEEAFIGFLKKIYDERFNGRKVAVDSATGGSPASILQYTLNKLKCGSYDRCVMVLDADVPLPEKFFEKALRQGKKLMPRGAKGVEVVLVSPCIEGLFLDILEHPGFSRSTAIASSCKGLFHSQYISQHNACQVAQYYSILTKERIEKARIRLQELNSIIEVICQN